MSRIWQLILLAMASLPFQTLPASAQTADSLVILSFNVREWTRDTDESKDTYWKRRMEAMEKMIPTALELLKDPAKIKRRMQKLKDLYLNDLIELDDYKAEYDSLRAQLEAETPSAPPPAPVDLEQIAAALPIYESLTPARKKAFWSSTIRRITITNDDKFIVEPISP